MVLFAKLVADSSCLYMHRYGVQIDVLKQLGGKLETNLKLQETQLNQTPRTEAAKRRATLIKLNRDFRRVEAVFKNLVLDSRRQNVPLKAKKQNHYQPDSGAGGEISEEEQRMQLELQLQQDVSVNSLCGINRRHVRSTSYCVAFTPAFERRTHARARDGDSQY